MRTSFFVLSLAVMLGGGSLLSCGRHLPSLQPDVSQVSVRLVESLVPVRSRPALAEEWGDEETDWGTATPPSTSTQPVTTSPSGVGLSEILSGGVPAGISSGGSVYQSPVKSPKAYSAPAGKAEALVSSPLPLYAEPSQATNCSVRSACSRFFSQIFTSISKNGVEFDVETFSCESVPDVNYCPAVAFFDCSAEAFPLLFSQESGAGFCPRYKVCLQQLEKAGGPEVSSSLNCDAISPQ